MVGLPCSGKTTYARKLEIEEKALRFTPDEWQIKLFPQRLYDENSNHDIIHDRIEKIIWSVAADALKLGVSVILDFGFWAKEERDDFRLKAMELGVGFKIHFMDIPKDELIARLLKRNTDADSESFICEPRHIEQWYKTFEPPDEDELRSI